MTRRILLVDGMFLLYRAYFSSRLEFNSKGEPINALKRYLRIIHSVNMEYPIDEIIICEDSPKSTLFRQQMFGEYKMTRKKPPDEFLQQKGILFGFLRKIGFPVIGVNGYEADDIIGTLSRSLSEDGYQVIILSSDKDMFQLLTNDRISILRTNQQTKQQELLYRDDIYENYGYWPEQVTDMKVLTGDQSDNIPGVPKCGYKHGVQIIKKYGDLNKFMESSLSEQYEINVKKYIEDNHEQCRMIKDLVTIKRDIDPDIISKQLSYRVSTKTFDETMNRYEVMSPDDFMALSFSGYIYNRLKEMED